MTCPPRFWGRVTGLERPKYLTFRIAMIVIVGCVVVTGCVLAGFTWSGGHIGALIHPAEIVTIGGASMGALIMMSPKKILGDLARGVMQAMKGAPFNKNAYRDLFGLLYDIMQVARRDGMLGLES